MELNYFRVVHCGVSRIGRATGRKSIAITYGNNILSQFSSSKYSSSKFHFESPNNGNHSSLSTVVAAGAQVLSEGQSDLRPDESTKLGRLFSFPGSRLSNGGKHGCRENDDELFTARNLLLDDSLYRNWIAMRFSAVLESSPSPRKEESDQSDDYHVNVGYAIRTIREELPTVFYKEINYNLYRDDIVFRDPMNTFSGIKNYKLIYWALRFNGQIFFKHLRVDVLRIWKPCENVIMVRWCVRGIPRVPWEAQGHFDGTSEYKLDKEGKIYEHRVDNVIMNDRRLFAPVSVADFLRLAGVRQTPTPTFFRQARGGFQGSLPYLLSFSWVRFYLALRSTITLSVLGGSL